MIPKPASIPRLVLIALVGVMQVTAPVADLHAAKFDEKLKAPEAPTNDGLITAIREYFDVYARATVETSSGIVRDRAAFEKWFDTDWRLGRAIDTKRNLGDLSEFGITPKDDGSFRVDIATFPQWRPLHEMLLQLATPELLEAYSVRLKERGFRDQDLEVLKAYVETNQPRRATLAQSIELGETFAAKVKLQLSKRQKIGIAQVLSYTYQSNRINLEAERAWCVGLLDSLDSQRQRIIESYFDEMGRTGSKVIGPSDLAGQSDWLIGVIASGEYQQLIEKEKMEVRQ